MLAMCLILRIAEQYLWHGSLCRMSGGTQAGCTWRAPEVGAWMEFADLDEDGEMDCGCTSNENGGAHPTSTTQNRLTKWWMQVT